MSDEGREGGLRPEDLHGTWRLERWEAVDDDGGITEPYGPDPLGYVVYTPGGTMLTTVSRADRGGAADAETDPTVVDPGAADSFVAYSGRYRMDGPDVIHIVEMSLISAWIGTEQRRHVELRDDGTTLILSTDPRVIGDRRQRHRLRWHRIS